MFSYRSGRDVVMRIPPRIFARRRLRRLRKEARSLLLKSQTFGVTGKEKQRLQKFLPHLFRDGLHTVAIPYRTPLDELRIDWYHFRGKRRGVM